jgi:hypothetical protein
LNQQGMTFMVGAVSRALAADRSLGAAAVSAAQTRSGAGLGQVNIVVQPGAFQTTIEKDDPDILAKVNRLPQEFLNVVRQDIRGGMSGAIIKQEILRR